MQAFLTTIITKGNRIKIISEANRILKERGTLYLADFGQNWENTYYRERYNRDYLVTEELGTFLVRENSKIHSRELFRAHHYTKEELLELVSGLLLKISRDHLHHISR